MPEALEGGCLCGAVRYRLKSAPYDAGYCHCHLCQAVSGAPVLVFATVPRDDFVLVSGEPRRFRSSDFGERWFCGNCGSALAMRVDHQPDTIDITVASLDRPDLVPPGFHIWRQSKMAWFETTDTLPRFERFRPHTRGLAENQDP